jgi:hypothetical protein
MESKKFATAQKKNSVLLNGHEGWTLVIESLVVMGLKKEKT